MLAPGFIDVHTHDDAALLDKPQLGFTTMQGVTSVVRGNCGFSPAPGSEGSPMPRTFTSMGEYPSMLKDRPPAVNIACWWVMAPFGGGDGRWCGSTPNHR